MSIQELEWIETRKKFIESLESIGWSIKGRNLNQHICNHLGKNTGYRLCSDRLELQQYGDSQPTMCFYFKDSKVEKLDGDTVCLSGKTDEAIFILFHNFNLKSNNLL